VERITVAAGPGLAELAGKARPSELSWWPLLGGWWKPIAALGAAAIALLVLVEAPVPAAVASTDALTLSIVAAEGEGAVALWAVQDAGADPVLALVALEDHATFAETGSEIPVSGGETR
jgi:hypothetical protein